MQISKSVFLEYDRQTVWNALNNPDILRLCIPGCEELDAPEENRFIAVAALKIGPMKVRFKGDVELSNIDAPNSYRISGQGRGGIAGYAKGGADVKLSDQDKGTLLHYDVEAQVGGRIAQLGSRLISSVAEDLSAKFFDNFSKALGGDRVDAKAGEPGPKKSAPRSNKDWLLPYTIGLGCGILIGLLGAIAFQMAG